VDDAIQYETKLLAHDNSTKGVKPRFGIVIAASNPTPGNEIDPLAMIWND
jgi:hypothetical protein